MTTAEKAGWQQVASLSGWDVAAHYGCSYIGDCNAIDHGGYFYDPRDWEPYGYASVVEFWRDPEDDDVLYVQRGTVHRPQTAKEWRSAWSCIGAPEDDTRHNVHAQIDAARSWGGIETDGTSYPALKTFRTTDWHEWRIWRSVHDWLAALGNHTEEVNR
jgi:hypothetical protein